MKTTSIIIAIAVIVVAGLIAYFVINANPTDQATQDEGVVATVNGVEISRESFEKELTAAKKTITDQGQGDQLNDSTKLTQLESQVLDQLINNELIKQEIEKAGLTVADEDVQAQYDQVVTNVGGQEALIGELEKANITDDQLKENIRNQMLVDQFINSQISEDQVAVTDEEVEAFYNQSIEGQENVPTLEEVKEQLRSQISQQKGAQLVSDLIESLRSAASIETFLSTPEAAADQKPGA